MKSITDTALKLPREERASPEAEVEALWLVQAARRASEIDQGLVKLIPGEQVMREALALCR